MAGQDNSGEDTPRIIDLDPDHAAVHEGEDAHSGPRVIDLDRAALPGPPPMPGAQWDELRRRWERWNAVRGIWELIDRDDEQVRVVPRPRLIPAFLAREIHGGELAEADGPRVIDVDRLAPTLQPAPGAQWNEIAGRWERWDTVAGAWVEVALEQDADA